MTSSLAPSPPIAVFYISSSLQISGGAAVQATSRKEDKYTELPKSYLFQLISFEKKSAQVNSSAEALIEEVGNQAKDSVVAHDATLVPEN